MSMFLSTKKGISLSHSTSQINTRKGINPVSKRSFETFLDRTWKYAEGSSRDVASLMDKHKADQAIFATATKDLPNAPKVINADEVSKFVGKPSNVFDVSKSYLSLTKDAGMPVWYELEIGDKPNSYPWADLKSRSGIFMDRNIEATNFAEILFRNAWERNKETAIVFAQEAKETMIEFVLNPKMFDALKRPNYSSQQKLQTLGKYFKSTPDDKLPSQNMQLLFLLLTGKNKLSLLPSVLRGVFMLGFAAQGGVIGSVTTVAPLPAAARKEFTDIVQKEYMKSGDKLVLQFKSSPSLIGGYTLALPTVGLVDKSWAKSNEKFPHFFEQAVERAYKDQYGTPKEKEQLASEDARIVKSIADAKAKSSKRATV